MTTYPIIVKKDNTFNGVLFRISPEVEIVSAKAQIKKSASSSTVILELTPAAGNLIIGTSSIIIPAQIFTIPVSTYYYLIQMTFSNTYVKSWIEGSFIVEY
jgi:hypothetical protein